MPRRQRSVPLDILSGIEAGRHLSHPIDYLDLLLGWQDGRVRFVEQQQIDRLAAMISGAREEVLRLDRGALVGGSSYGVIVDTPAGPVIEIHRLPLIENTEMSLQPGRDFVFVDVDTTGENWRTGDRIVGMATVTGRMLGTLAYPEEGGPPFIPRGEDRLRRGHIENFGFNPGRDSTPEAEANHGIPSTEHRLCPPFAARAEEVRNALIRDRTIIVLHDKPRVVGFLNMEFERAGLEPLTGRRFVDIIDLRGVSERLWPGEPATLDAISARLGVEYRDDPSARYAAWGTVTQLARCLPLVSDAVTAAVLEMRAKDRARQEKPKSGSRARK